jgi:hypothetical protein
MNHFDGGSNAVGCLLIEVAQFRGSIGQQRPNTLTFPEYGILHGFAKARWHIVVGERESEPVVDSASVMFDALREIVIWGTCYHSGPSYHRFSV